jgi:hypothetical protein
MVHVVSGHSDLFLFNPPHSRPKLLLRSSDVLPLRAQQSFRANDRPPDASKMMRLERGGFVFDMCAAHIYVKSASV